MGGQLFPESDPRPKVPYHQLELLDRRRDLAAESFATASDCELELPIDVSLNHYLELCRADQGIKNSLVIPSSKLFF